MDIAISCGHVIYLSICLHGNLLQNGQDCFLLACEEGHEEIVCELLTKDEVDRTVVDNVRN